MKLYLIFLILIFTSCSKNKEDNTNTILAKSNKIATLTKFENNVTIKKSNDLNWFKASVGFPFESYDIIQTEQKSTASVMYEDSSRLELKENSLVIIVKNIKESNKVVKVVKLDKGIIKGKITELAKRENSFEIRTKSGLLKIKPKKTKKNSFFVALKENGELKVKNSNAQIKIITHNFDKNVIENSEVIIKAGISILDKKTGLPIISKDRLFDNKKALKEKIDETEHFEILFPNSEVLETTKNVIVIKGLVSKYKLLLNGKKVSPKKGKFKISVSLEMGLNLFTFQAISKNDVKYKVLKVIRK